MIDIRIHPIAFGGRAFEPLTDAGRNWCKQAYDDKDSNSHLYFPPDGCMTGFDYPTFGCEPRAFEGCLEAAREAGLTLTLA